MKGTSNMCNPNRPNDRCWGGKILALMLLLLTFTATASAQAQFQQGDIYIGAFSPPRIYKVNPSTFSVTIFADFSDGLRGTSALAFSPDGTTLLSSNCGNNIIGFDSSGNGAVLFDSSDGLRCPFGENGLAFDSGGNLYVSDFGLRQILRFPAALDTLFFCCIRALPTSLLLSLESLTNEVFQNICRDLPGIEIQEIGRNNKVQR